MRILASAAMMFALLLAAHAEPAAPPGASANVESPPASAPPEPAATPDAAGGGAKPAGARAGRTDYALVCETLQTAAKRYDLPISFLTRLIWQESRFDSNAVSPAGARGVAQFMPATAAGLGLANPFDTTQAINKSAEFLRDLEIHFGNLGLAAAAYNAGPKHVREWLDGHGGLPGETEAYVRIVTGHAASDWRAAQPKQWSLMLPDALPCPQLVKLLTDKPETISPQEKPGVAPARPVWALQLIGDPSQGAAIARFRQLQKSYRTILGGLQPMVLPYKVGRSVSWYQVRVAANSFFQAQKLCAGLRDAGESCLVQEMDGRVASRRSENL